ncbi:aldehyde reductase [Mycena filopes]|nr:aldehyde reductase [Mycena filopes]
MTTHVKLLFGGFPIGSAEGFRDEASLEQVYKLLEEAGIDTIDTARAYGPSEEWLGKTGAGKRFILDSKTPGGFGPGGSTAEGIPQHAKETVERLGVAQVNLYYIHAPDPYIPLEDQLRGINTAYEAGRFKRFGLSNFTAADVQRAYDICKAHGYPLPSVYQGNYSALARKNEAVLIPTLRKLGMSFYVYSPIAGGLLTKTAAQLREGERGRPSYYKALDLWEEAAKEAGCTKAELAYRWVAKQSHILETAGWLKRGSVGEKAKAKIDEIWKVVEHEAPVDNYNK